jgi:holo-[acyl-carrier protein] synthase
VEIGVDIVEIDRIAKQIRNPRFLQRVFNPGEVKYCRSRKNVAQHFAVRFAAKEAVWKALASNGGHGLTHRDIQVRNHSNGKPEIIFPKRFVSLAKKVSISLTHGRDYAVAVALFQK